MGGTYEGKKLFTGTAQGGPMDGQVIESRFGEGVIFVDKKSNKVWVYDYDEQGTFTVREDEGRRLDLSKTRDTADGSKFDVRVLP